MPMYEFSCPVCAYLTVELCRIGETGERLACTKCGHVGVIKRISGFVSIGVPGGVGDCLGCTGNCTGCH